VPLSRVKPKSENVDLVVVSRWVSEAGRIRLEDDDFAADLESLDRSLSTKAIEELKG